MEDTMIRLQCLALALETEFDDDVVDILETAELFYDFVTDNGAE